MAEASVLIVDDDEPIRLMVATVLKRAGIRVDTAASGPEAVSKLERHSYAALVVDLAMPEISGADIVDRVAASGQQTKCVVLMSAGSESALNDVPENVVHTKLRKPFNIEEIVSAVQECVAGSIDHSQPSKRNYADKPEENDASG